MKTSTDDGSKTLWAFHVIVKDQNGLTPEPKPEHFFCFAEDEGDAIGRVQEVRGVAGKVSFTVGSCHGRICKNGENETHNTASLEPVYSL
jgi:hypothetical protein